MLSPPPPSSQLQWTFIHLVLTSGVFIVTAKMRVFPTRIRTRIIIMCPHIEKNQCINSIYINTRRRLSFFVAVALSSSSTTKTTFFSLSLHSLRVHSTYTRVGTLTTGIFFYCHGVEPKAEKQCYHQVSVLLLFSLRSLYLSPTPSGSLYLFSHCIRFNYYLFIFVSFFLFEKSLLSVPELWMQLESPFNNGVFVQHL